MTPPEEVAALCALDDPYLPSQDSEPHFHAAMLALTRYHCERTPGYQRWLRETGVRLDSIAASGQWSDLPAMHASYFKRHVPRSDQSMSTTTLYSSGTSGQKSEMHYDDHSLAALMHMSDRIFDHHGWHTPDQPCNYLLFSYAPDQDPAGLGNVAGSARTDQFLCRYAPAERVVFALGATGAKTGASHEFDPWGAIRALQEFAEEGLPVRIFGFPAFLWFVLERMHALNIAPLALHPDSLVLTGGGWKQHAAREVDKAAMRRRLGEQLGIDPSRCRDGYGSVEHAVPYIECARHRFHVPSYARAHVRDPHDMRRLGYDEPGLLHLQSPYILSCPAHSILPGDVATLISGAQCGCGMSTDCFILHGRAGAGKSRSCALAASELINGRSSWLGR